MRTVTVELADAFTDGGKGGNPAGIVAEGAADLTPAQRQEVARQVAVSETAFVLPSETADYKLEFYTPTRPIPHCGHATVATFARLAETGRLTKHEVVNETPDGPRRIRMRDTRAFLEQVPARMTELGESTRQDILESLGMAPDALLSEVSPFLGYNGNGSIQIGVASIAILRGLRPDMQRIQQITNRFDAVCYYVFSLSSLVSGRDATARMFGPAYGIAEEAATGMASGPLACWLASRGDGERREFLIEQGHLMSPASPSLIIAHPEYTDGKLARMWIGGSARVREVRHFQV
jgi:PhzF family phenazine biosynthesis protein